MNGKERISCRRTLPAGKINYLHLGALVLLIGSWSCLHGQVVYVPNNNDETISAFVINSDAGILTELGRVYTPGRPTAVAVEPRGKFVYVTNAADANVDHNVSSYSIDPASGALTPLPFKPAPLGGFPVGASADAAGRFLYVAIQSNNTVVGYTINGSTGALTRMPNTPFATGKGPSGVVVDAAGKFVYVVNQGSNDVWAYAINPATGALAPIAGSPFGAGRGPSRVTKDAAGKWLYVANQGSNNVSAYAINASTGALAAVPGSPFAAGAGPTAVDADPAGRFLYVSNGDGNTVSAYTIDSGSGALLAVAGSPFASQRGPYGVVVDAQSKFVYVANLVSNNVTAYAVNAGSGALSPLPGSPYPAGGLPQRLALAQLSPPVLPPVVARSALNAASYALPGLPHYGVAQGSMFVVFGQNLGPAAFQQASAFPLQTQLGGTSVSVTAGGVTRPAIMVYTFVTQVAAILPSSTPVGDGTLTVTYNNRTSPPIPIKVVGGSAGIFTRNQGGSGPAIAQNYNSGTDQPLNGVTEAAHPGQTMVLWATGLGPVSFDETNPPAGQSARNNVEVWVGSKRANVFYSGRSGFPAIDQINFTLPADAPLGCYVPVAVRLGGAPAVVSNFATIAISSQGKICSDAHGLSSNDWAALQSRGTLNVGLIQLMRINVTADIPGLGSGSGLVDSGWAEIFRWNAVTGAAEQGIDMYTGRGTSFGGCSVYTFGPDRPSLISRHANFLNAGPALNLAGPKGSRQLLQSEGYYESRKALGGAAPPGIAIGSLPPPFWEPGTIAVDNASGGADVGPFRATLVIPAAPAPLTWTNFDAIAAGGIDRTKDLVFTWTGGDPAKEYVLISGAVILPGIGSDLQVAAGFTCTETASAGQLTVPAVVLSALPASSADAVSGVLMASRSQLLTDSLKFTATGLDLGYLTYAVFNATTVAFQ
ncbi:MAG: beta-propeller fold lactonase family protein [Acidobacteriia bacterium]|nr:beta-propeller fold lactonase family protein [Terriglobia bacterium]